MNPGFCVATLHATFLSLILQGLPKPVTVRDSRRKRVEVAPNERNHLITVKACHPWILSRCVVAGS